MGRCYKEVTKDFFIKKVKSLMENEEFPYELPKPIEKDLGKVMFDWENHTRFNDRESYSKYLLGYKEIIPGFHTFFCSAGGDWEFPVSFIFYWGEDKLRAYIPKNGNAWNKKFKCAYGSEGEFDYDYEYPNDFDEEKEIDNDLIIEDIKSHFTLKK